MRIARWAFKISLLTPLAALLVAPFVARPAQAQDQDQDNSLAAAARRAQEQKKDQPRAAKVYDNSNLPTTGVSVVGQQPSAAGSSTTDTTSSSTPAADAKPAPTAAEVAQLNSALDVAKQRVADLKADLDVAQRKYALDQQTYYGKPNFVADRSGAAALDSEKSDVDAKADAVAAAEKLLAAAQAKADEAGKAATQKAAQDKAAQDSASSPPAPAAPAPPAAPSSNTDR